MTMFKPVLMFLGVILLLGVYSMPAEAEPRGQFGAQGERQIGNGQHRPDRNGGQQMMRNHHDSMEQDGKYKRGGFGQQRQFGEGKRGGGKFDREKIKKELMALPPEERKARMEQLRSEHKGRMEERRQKLEQRWQNASEGERMKFCQKVQQKCQQEGKKMACKMVENKCRK